VETGEGGVMPKKKKRNKHKHLTRHHILPRSRGGEEVENVVIVNAKKHDIYHRLFDNMTPEEIIEYLVEEFWGDKWEYVTKALINAGKMY